MFLSTVFSGALSAWLAGLFHALWVKFWRALGRAPAAAKALPSAWLAGATQRWHTHSMFADTQDRVDGHSARVAILILQLVPGAPVELLRAALTHDLGESMVGDKPSPFKRAHPALNAKLEAVEAATLSAMGFEYPPLYLSDEQMRILKLCDELDAWLWARTHRPDFVKRHPAWRAMFARLRAEARDLGLVVKFDLIVKGVCDGKF